ncbi:MAG: hypothetical protein KIH01_03090 [Candidatus Freyarchaeota archaeon]|nr:hypothetical protein [Candidatus Jordarchaeia archaeon]
MEGCDSNSVGARSGLLPVLAEIKRRLENVYGDKVVDVIPYGVGLFGGLSSVDAAVVLKEEKELKRDEKRIRKILKELIKGKAINIHVISQDKLEHAKWPLYIQKGKTPNY